MTPLLLSRTRWLALLAVIAGFPRSSPGEDLYSPVSGYLKIECRGGADTRVSAPFHRVAAWSGPLTIAPQAGSGGAVLLSVTLPVEIGVGAFSATPHWVLCREPSSTAGRHFRVTAHHGSSLDVEGSVADWTGIAAGARIEVIPSWTLDSLFPPGQQSTFHLSTGRLAPERGSELLLFNEVGRGTKLAPSRRFFITATGWTSADGFVAAGETTIAPGQAFLIRHPAGAATTEFVVSEQVYGDVVRLGLRVSGGRGQDTTLAPPRPVKVALGTLDLGPGFFEESASTDPADRKDELLVFDNTAPGINKLPSAVFFRTGGQWIRDTAGFPTANLVTLELSTGLVIRKASGVMDVTVQWPHAAPYDLVMP